jgi:serine/threonine-protein kinase
LAAGVTPGALASCPTCKAVFRGGFQRCPNDGTRLDQSSQDPLVGHVLAERYQIEGVIGDGGIGRVYRARHVRMSRRFAIKVPFGELGYDRKARARFANEAEAASRLSHPNVIGIVDVGETGEGLFYMAMDLAEGVSLADVIADGPMAEAKVLPLLVQLADGLGHAHDRGLIHRDLKPENVILTPSSDGGSQVRIVDFGLAIVERIDTKERDRLTTQGVVLGTPHYMAPEQATDEELDLRIDLFALGIILFEMLAGVHPFDGAPMDVARQNLSRELPTILMRAAVRVDPALEALVTWMTRKSPSERPKHASQVAQYARHLLAGQRAAAQAMLPDLPVFRSKDAIGREAADEELAVPGSEPAPAIPPGPTPAAERAAADPAAGPMIHVPELPRVAKRAPTTERVEHEDRGASRRRWIIVAIVVLLFGGIMGVVLLGGRGKERGALAIDAAVIAQLPADAAMPVIEPIDAPDLAPPPDAGDVREPPTDARATPRRVDAALVARPIDAGVIALVVDAAPRPKVDAAVPDEPATSLKGLYAQVGRALDTAVAKHGRDATAELSARYARVPPYLEAARKPELRAEAESQLKSLLRDLAPLK